jgi:hypothetical protein
MGSAVLGIVSALFGAAAVELLLWQGRKNDVEKAIKAAQSLGPLTAPQLDIIRAEIGLERHHQWTPLIACFAVLAFFAGLWLGLRVTGNLLKEPLAISSSVAFDIDTSIKDLSAEHQFGMRANYIFCKQIRLPDSDIKELMEALVSQSKKSTTLPKCKDWLATDPKVKSSGTFGAPNN